MCNSISLPAGIVTRRESNIKILRATVVFGSPQRQCTGSGLCNVIGPSDWLENANYCDCRKAIASIIWLSDYVLFQFVRSSFSDACYQKYFQDSCFLVEEYFEYLPKGWAESFRIQVEPGCYQAYDNGDYVRLFFPRIKEFQPEVASVGSTDKNSNYNS